MARWLVFAGGLISLAISCSAFAQQADTSGFARIRVTADVDSAIVLIDGVVAGRTPLSVDTITAGTHTIRVQHPDLESWLAPVIQDTITAEAGGTMDLQYRLNSPYLIRSDPYGAEVFSGETLLGMTPLVVDSAYAQTTLSLRKPGYAILQIQSTGAVQEGAVAKMEKLPDQIGGQGDIVRGGNFEGRSPVPVVLMGISSVVSGVLAAHFKVAADNSYSDYLQSGDPAMRAETRRLDTQAAISLVVSQVCFSVFTYLLFSP